MQNFKDISFLGENVSVSPSYLSADEYVEIPLQFNRQFSLGLNGQQYLILALFTVPILLSFHPASIVRRVFYYLPLVLLFQAFRTPCKLDASSSFTGGYHFGLLLSAWTLRIIDRLYLNSPEETFFRNTAYDDTSEMPINYSPLKKFMWAIELISVTRGIGWNWQISQIPSQQTLSRGAFVWMRFSKAFGLYLALRLVILSSDILLALAARESHINPAIRMILFNRAFLHLYIYACWAFIVYCSLDLADNILAIFFVSTSIYKPWSEPSAWPPVFGSFYDSYGLRRLWAKFWHQNFRRSCGSVGEFIVQCVPYLANPKTKKAVLVRRYTRVLCTFLVSGMIHAGGSLYMSQHSHPTDGGNVKGFFYQALVIIAEDLVLHLLKIKDDGNPSFIRLVLGYLFTHGYAAYAVPALKVIPLAMDHHLRAAGHPLIIGVKMVGIGARGVLKNPFSSLIGNIAA